MPPRLRADIYAAIALIAVVAVLFAPHLLGRALFLGDSDRLNTFLNIRKFEVESLRAGRLSAWNEFQFMGMGMFSLPYMAPDPLMAVEAMVPTRHLLAVAGIVACGLVTLAALVAYISIQSVVGDRFSAFVGAAIYPTSTYAILRISQVDSSFLLFLHVPLVMLLIRRVRGGGNGMTFLALTATLTSLFAFTFLQEVAYAILLFGTYALYRAAVAKSILPASVLGSAGIIAAIIAAPRLITVLGDLQLFDRARVSWAPNRREILRFFYDGIFGRFHSEARTFGTAINLHEGLLLYTSTFAALLIVVALVRFRRRWFGLLRTSHCDAAFHGWCLIIVVGAILTPPGQRIVDRVFLKAPFLHARLCLVALFSISVLVAMILADMRRSLSPGGGQRWWMLGGAALGVIVVAALTDAPQTSLRRLLGVVPVDIGDRMTLVPLELVRLVSAVVMFAGLAVVWLVVGRYQHWCVLLTTALGIAIVIHTLGYAAFKIFGPYTWSYPIPFQANNFFTIRPSQLTIPSAAAVAAFREELLTSEYRSGLICDPKVYAVFCAPHIAQFWRWRLVDGYVPGVPARLAALPWPDGVRTLRAISFPSVAAVPWRLLALLNVRQVIEVNEALYFNTGRGHGGGEATPNDVRIHMNPVPVTPRHFFTRTIRVVATPAAAAEELRRRLAGAQPIDLRSESLVEGFTGQSQFSSAGSIGADYDGDVVRIHVDPMGEPRFLVVNELYHPGWRAFAGRDEVPIWPTNVVMRGLLVPPGVSDIELRYVPFLLTWQAKGIVATGLLVAGGGWWVLRT